MTTKHGSSPLSPLLDNYLMWQRWSLLTHTIAFPSGGLIKGAVAAFGVTDPVSGTERIVRRLRAYAGRIMGATQSRHFKLWYAGKLRNWELASYELGPIEDSLINAARLYQNIPVEKINMIQQPLITLSGATKAKNGARFARAFANLTAACNICHEAAM